MLRKSTIAFLSVATLAFCLSSNANAQMFKRAQARRADRQNFQPQNSFSPQSSFNQRNHQPNARFRGGLPMRDTVPRGPAIRHRIRDNRVMRDGSLEWVPRAQTPVVDSPRQPVYNPPARTRSPYAAGPTVGGRFQIQTRPRPTPKTSQPTGWQPWMHVPLDGSQPWNQ